MSQNKRQIFRQLELKKSMNKEIQQENDNINQNLQIENLDLLYNIQLKEGDFFGESFINVQYELIVPENWKLIKGCKSGISHTSSTNTTSNTKVPFNFCFSFLFETSDLTYLPSLIFYVFGVDFFGRPKILGYSKILLYPNQNIKKNVQIFKPLPINNFSGIFGSIFGKRVQYKDAKDTIGFNKGREYTRTECVGEIDIQIESISSNWETFGFNNQQRQILICIYFIIQNSYYYPNNYSNLQNKINMRLQQIQFFLIYHQLKNFEKNYYLISNKKKGNTQNRMF